MSLIQRLFGRAGGDPYTEGIALYEAGRFAEAIALLRRAQSGGRQSPRASLVNFHLRQALTAEGRRLLRVGQAAMAAPMFAEAIAGGDDYPDLKFLLGVARGLTGDWDEALRCSRDALRSNPDYSEARMLEACALIQMARRREAVDSLNKLLEAGRRQEHPLIHDLGRPEGYGEGDLPPDLVDRLREAVSGRPEEEAIGNAVALCRAGRWEEGLDQLRNQVRLHPGYADYHLKLAAALFQTGQVEAAKLEVADALRLNPRYRTAALLKALILADGRRLESARSVMNSPAVAGRPGHHGHEDLFASYLEGVLNLLTGRLAAVGEQLAPWGDLTGTFPKATLLQAAAADLSGQPAVAAPLLASLAGAWPAEADFRAYLVSLHLRWGDLERAERALGQWPPAHEGVPDDRPLLLRAMVSLARGQPAAAGAGVAPAKAWKDAWRFLEVRQQVLTGQWAEAWREASALAEEGYATERLAQMLTQAAVHLTGSVQIPADWLPPTTVPDETVPHLIYLLHRQDRVDSAQPLITRLGRLHPQDLRWTWLQPAFWLDPIRRWIG
jgi:tetratricopeptide (TPR) repeat protein